MKTARHYYLPAFFLLAGLGSSVYAQNPWVRPELVEPNRISMTGAWGKSYTQGLARIGAAPYETPFILSDVSFTTNRWFTNYSGDISGRFIELASLASSPDNPQPAALKSVLLKISSYQKPDGHFGATVDWGNPDALKGEAWDNKVMPLMWGNGRLLLGLTAAAQRFNDPMLLNSAKKLGDFYINVAAPLFCDQNKRDFYIQNTGYASAYVTCVYEGMEGLVQLYNATKEKRYLDIARRMADFHEAFDVLPIGHSHGSLSQHEALILLYEACGDAKYLDRVVARWNAAVQGGYVSPVGSVLEKFVVTGYNRDEGCSEADWLRLNLLLWRNTGEGRYLDMAERIMSTEMVANQWPDGGFGHRCFGLDEAGPFSFREYSQEALWCCTFHGPLGLRELKSYLATGTKNTIEYQFPVSFEAPVSVGKSIWSVKSDVLPVQAGTLAASDVTLKTASGKGKVALWVRVPEWATYVQAESNGKNVPLTPARYGYVKTKPLPSGTTIRLAYNGQPYLENRRLQRVALPQNLPAKIENVVVRSGPYVLVNDNSGEIQAVNIKVKPSGEIQLPAAESGIRLVPWYQVKDTSTNHAFVFHAQLEPTK